MNAPSISAIRPLLSLADLQAYDPLARAEGRERRYLCPLCGDDKPKDAAHRSFAANVDTGAWKCHRCSQFGLLAEHRTYPTGGQRHSQAASSPPARITRGRSSAVRPSLAPIPPASGPADLPAGEWLEWFQDAERIAATPAEAYLAGRSIPVQLADAAGVRFSPAWRGRPAVVFPLHDAAGQLVAAQGRRLIAASGPPISGGMIKAGVFATPGAWNADPVIVTEAPIDALSLAACGFPALALCGTAIREWMLMRLALRRVLLAFDADEPDAKGKRPGDDAAARWLAALHRYTPEAARLRPEGGKDWNEILTTAGPSALRSLLHRAPFCTPLASLRLDEFALSGRIQRVFSAALGEEVIFAADNAPLADADAPKPEGVAVVYRAREMAALLDTDPAGLALLHEVKRIFGGELLADENPAPAAGPGPALAAVPEIAPGDLFTASPSALPLDDTSLLDEAAPVQLADAPDQQGGQQQSSDGDALAALHPSPCADASAAPDQDGQHEAAESEAAEQAAPIRARTPYGGLKHWRTAYIDTVTGDGVDDGGQAVHLGERPALAAILAYALHTETRKVFLCGPIPAASPYKPGTQAAFDAWALAADASEEWQDGDGKSTSYLGNVQSGAALSEAFPVIRKQHRETQADCVLYRMAAWLGEGDYTPAAARAAMLDLAAMLWRHFGERVELTSTPAHTGQELWKLCTRGREYPTLPDDLQALIKSTSGQGRIEFCAAPGVATLPGFVYLDARFAYAASLQNLPAGLPVRDDLPDFVPNTRGRYRIRYEVPAGWDHIGLLMTPRDGSASEWEYPAAPGQIGETWAGWTEVHLAQKQGWKVQILERLLFPQAAGMVGDKAGPLDTWGRRLTVAYDEAGAGGQQLIKKALRSILLFGIGSFARNERPRRVVVPISDIELLPADNPTVHKNKDTGNFEYWASDPVPASRRRLQHPEWAAEVWARARTRMLLYEQKRGRGEVVASWGALAVPRESVIAIRTDALYLSCDPGWPDAGRPGDMRVKGQIAGPLAAPRSFSDLNKLREKSEKMHKQAEQQQQQSKQQKGGGNGE